ncbi:CHAT domain-containing protein [Xylaria sp. FL1777]|nr:CHAT domain-containing protein [Xylaria sp. FL1777]
MLMAGSDDLIQEARLALADLPEDHPFRILWLNNLGVELAYSYERTANAEVLEEAIQVGRQSLAATLSPDSMATCLSNLSCLLDRKYLHMRDRRDIEEAIKLAEEAVHLTPKTSSERPARLNNIAVALSHKYDTDGQIETLDQSIKTFRECVDTSTDSDLDLGKYLSNLGAQLRQRYQLVGSLEDLEESIRVGREAVSRTPKDDPDRAARATNLGTTLMDEFKRTGNRAHLDESTQLAKEASETTAESHVDSLLYQEILGRRFGEQFLRKGTISDLEDAIQVSRRVLSATPHGDPHRDGRLQSLSFKLENRFIRLGSLDDLHEALQLAQEAMSIPRSNYDDRASLLGHIGDLFAYRHARTGSMHDLEEAIHARREALHLCPVGSPNLASYHNTLSLWLSNRYLIVGAMEDLDEAIQNARAAIQMTPQDHPDLPAWLDNLGNQLYSKYLRSTGTSDLDNSIQATQTAVRIAPRDDPAYPVLLNNLAHGLLERFEKSSNPKDLEESILTIKEAVKMTPLDDPDYVLSLNVLAIALSKKYTLTNNLDYIEESITIARRVVEMTPDNHPSRAIFLTNLGLRLGDKCITTLDVDDMKEAAAYCDEALRQLNSPIVERIRAGMLAVGYHGLASNWEAAWNAGSVVVPLIPKLTPRSLKTSDKQWSLSQYPGLASSAAAAALEAKATPFSVLALLEQGRNIVAASLEDMRGDVLDLKKKYPELAKQFDELRDKLQPHVDNETTLLKRAVGSSHQPQGNRLYETNEDLDKLIVEIRQKPGFEDFFGIPNEDEMKAAARDGPVVVINACDDRCDAILINQTSISILPLPKLKNKDIEKRARRGNVGNLNTLAWLWDTVAYSVLDALGYTKTPSSGPWPRLWWVLTGALVNFPIHVAGRYYPGSSETVLDRVMSSYVSSVKALIHGRRRPRHQVRPSAQFSARAVLVNMHRTPGHGILPFATREVDIVRDICKAMSIEYSEPERTKEHVVSCLKNCEIFHFAGHGHADREDPALSYLLLNDWKDDPLTVSSLFDMNLRENSPFLAYLSACETGQNREENLADENFHLIGACQLAGFRHVIGTLWEVSDELCVDVARITYRELVRGGMTDESVCKGLHKATRELRDRWLRSSGTTRAAYTKLRDGNRGEADDDRGPRKTILCDSEDENNGILSMQLHWSPYVHFGV